MKVNIEQLAAFLSTAKHFKYGLNLNRVIPLEEISLKNFYYMGEDFHYTANPYGRFSETEIVREGGSEGPIIWTLYHFGGMRGYFNNEEQASITYKILFKALHNVKKFLPLRGMPLEVTMAGDSAWVYTSDTVGDITRFTGHERIFFEDSEVYNGDFIGGLI